MLTVEFNFEIDHSHSEEEINETTGKILKLLEDAGYDVQSNVSVPVGTLD